DEAHARVADMVGELSRAGQAPIAKVFHDSVHEDQLWRLREAALAATARVPGMADTWPGWEDSAVPSDRLGDYLHDFSALLDEFGYGDASLYGHFGHGCLHVSIPFDFATVDGVRAYRAFVERAADL